MAISPTSPVTGGAQTGFTAPTYPLVADIAPSQNGKQYAVIGSLGGTQVGVTTHSVSSPFTITFFKPAAWKVLGKPHPVTGLIANVGKNRYSGVARKGVTVLAGQPIQTAIGGYYIDVPAGADTADPANVRALISLMIGALTQISAGLGDTTVSGVM
jgi:hypothetical protein